MSTFIEEKNNTTTALLIHSDVSNQDISKLSNLSEANKKKIEELSNQLINTDELSDKIDRLVKSKKIQNLLALRNYFSREFVKRTLAREKYSNNYGFVLTKNERKKRYYVDLKLAPLMQLNDELIYKNKYNKSIKIKISEIEKLNG